MNTIAFVGVVEPVVGVVVEYLDYYSLLSHTKKTMNNN